jgi:ribosome-binding factor A
MANGGGARAGFVVPWPLAAEWKEAMRKVETPEGRSVRLLRVGEQVRHVLANILMRGEVHDDTLASHLVSVTEVRM